MDPEEIEFLAEKEYITIIPTFNNAVIHLITGDVGPFRASIPTRVPLWMAVTLKQQQRCKIQPPDWMTVEKLEEIKEDEKQSANFTKMPSDHYMVEAKVLLDCASDDIPKADEVRTVIKDIWDIRMSKIRSSVTKLVKNSEFYAAVDNLTVMEINSMRPILPHALDQLYRIKSSRRLKASQNSSNLSSYLRRSTSFNFTS
ncbi:DNA replication complex GINS protein PSF2 [Diabrotica virgifera virgifera]|uniref:DNA replication complex GINS protein PSF2 n=1 Tax=Diabrotica virgifera virgifera TaxID=50390 RepID=A0A6P7GEM6_DIAVI|nr:DNA replication complex GINS protein PSF2 [Diabrotica virgifera virgifera]